MTYVVVIYCMSTGIRGNMGMKGNKGERGETGVIVPGQEGEPGDDVRRIIIDLKIIIAGDMYLGKG